MSDAISEQDRQAIYEVLLRYVWCMDTGDIEGLVACFTPDGIVKDFRDTWWDLPKGGARGFAQNYIRTPGRIGGQHWVQFLFDKAETDGARTVTSYWASPTVQGEGGPRFSSLGRYIDTCVKLDGRWLIRQKVIDPWTDQTVESLGLKAVAS